MPVRPALSLPLVLVATFVLATACASSRPPVGDAAPLAMDSLVTTEWLARQIADPDLVVLDCTVRVEPAKEGGFRILNGRADYEAGHIPGAGFADLAGELSGEGGPFAFSLPAPERFAAAMGALGVSDSSRVVLYSAGRPDWAARVWWMLRWIGFDRAALLDGGLDAWKAEGRPLSTEVAVRPARRLSVALRPRLVADRNEVRSAVGNAAVTLIDALPAPLYQGKVTMYGRPGHIPGATNVPASALTDPTTRFLPSEQLAALHPGDRSERVITYCGGGISASANAFVMTRLGFTNVAVYMASLQEWTADPSNPMEVDAPE